MFQLDYYNSTMSNEFLNDVFMSLETDQKNVLNDDGLHMVEEFNVKPAEVFRIEILDKKIAAECKQFLVSIKYPLKRRILEAIRVLGKSSPFVSSRAFSKVLENEQFMRENKVLNAINEALDNVDKVLNKYGLRIVNFTRDNKFMEGELSRFLQRKINDFESGRSMFYWMYLCAWMYIIPGAFIYKVASGAMISQMLNNNVMVHFFKTDVNVWNAYYKGRALVYMYNSFRTSIHGYVSVISNKRDQEGRISISSLRIVKVGGFRNRNSFEDFDEFDE